MEIRKAAYVVAMVALVVMASGCKSVSNADYFVVSLKDVDNPSQGCGVFPDKLYVRNGVKWIVVANYIQKEVGDLGKNSVKVEVSNALINGSEPKIIKTLKPGEIMSFKLKKGLISKKEYRFEVSTPTEGCLKDLPNPRIVIP